MTILSLDIIPETETIDLFDEENTAPNEVYILRGQIELRLTRPVHIRQITVEFRGILSSAISLDYPEQKMWDQTEPELQILIDRTKRRPSGIAEATQVLIREHTAVVDQPTLLRAGVSRWPFELRLNNIQSLPPSLLLPRHSISYELSAYIKLTSLRERVKISYWNVRSKAVRRVSVAYRRLSNSMLPPHQDQSTPPSSPVGTSDQFNKKRNRLLSTSTPIKVQKHSHASLQALSCIPRVRYRGSRVDRMHYHVSTAKFACLQQKILNVGCDFFPLHPDAEIEFVELSLDQMEIYPRRAGRITATQPLPPNLMVQRTRRFYPFSIPLNVPQLSQSIKTIALQVTHKLRLTVHFRSNERKMSLSFPVSIGTVPGAAQHAVYHQAIDDSASNFEENIHKLPSYHDVLYEGAPPCPFLEENEPAPTYVQ